MTEQLPCPCVICRAQPPGRDVRIVSTVREHGWGVLRVPGTFEFAYTVGLWHTLRLPELVMFGLDGENMQHWLNACVDRVREQGPPPAGEPFGGVLEGFETQLRPVDESWRDAFFGTAYRFYQGWPVPVWQLVWPDAAGRWPWHDEATPSSRTRQAFAWLPVARHPAGSWRLLGEFGDGFPLPAEADSLALTSRSVLEGRRPPGTVLFDDGAFDVLDERGHDADDLCLTYLGVLVQRHPALGGLAGMPDGAVATIGTDSGWQWSALTAPLRQSSLEGWKRAEGPLTG